MASFKVFKAGTFALTIIAVLLAFLVYATLPPAVPTHWNMWGEVDGFGPSWFAAFLIPIMMVFVLLLFVIIPIIEVFKKNLHSFERQYWILGYAIQLFFLLFFAITLLPDYGYVFNFNQLFMLPMAMLFITIGVLLPSFKRNFLVGIRTPWTLANDTVWKKTHDLGGKAFILAGFALLISLPFPNAIFFVLIADVILVLAATVLYSYLEYRKNPKADL
ncbi:MAG: SdpI family protein [archaeon]